MTTTAKDTFPALRRECACGCEYITIILHKPGFVDAEPVCPACKGEGAGPTEAICDHAGVEGCYEFCGHRKAHPYIAKWCPKKKCHHTQATVRCIPVADGKERAND